MAAYQFKKSLMAGFFVTAFMWIFFIYVTDQIFERMREAPDDISNVLLYDKAEKKSFFVSFISYLFYGISP